MTILNQAYLSAGTPGSPTLVGTVSTLGGTFNLMACNQNTSGTVAFSCALVPNGGSIGPASWIEYLTPLDANQMWERGGIPLEAGATIYMAAASTGVSVTVAYMAGQ